MIVKKSQKQNAETGNRATRNAARVSQQKIASEKKTVENENDLPNINKNVTVVCKTNKTRNTVKVSQQKNASEKK